MKEGSTDYFDVALCDPCWAYFGEQYPGLDFVTDAAIAQLLQNEGTTDE